MRLASAVLIALGLFAASTPAVAEPAFSSKLIGQSFSPFMRVYGPVEPPYGYVRFCDGRPGECTAKGGEDRRVHPSPARLSELDEINRSVNHTIEPATDNEIYGVSEHWALPAKRGDCEDYALLKRKLLLRRGWPASALLLTVVRDEKGEGHAVLTARTAHGDFLLDNKIDDVRLWNATPYIFVMRQSYLNPRVWVSLNTSESSPSSLAGVEAVE